MKKYVLGCLMVLGLSSCGPPDPPTPSVPVVKSTSGDFEAVDNSTFANTNFDHYYINVVRDKKSGTEYIVFSRSSNSIAVVKRDPPIAR